MSKVRFSETIHIDRGDEVKEGDTAYSVSISPSPTSSSIDAFKTETKFTPRIGKKDLAYRSVEDRSAHALAPTHGTLSRPNYDDILRRVAMVIFNHVEKCESRFANAKEEDYETGLFHNSQMAKFHENKFLEPQYVFHFVRAPIVRLGFLYSIHEIKNEVESPTVSEIHNFLLDLFLRGQLSAECSIVCLIYVERLMERANVPLVASTWRSVVLCALLLASKVWQDLSSWNVEFSEIYPQFSLQSINKLERLYCEEITWDLYISSSTYAKYYFALRALTEKKGFRQNYNVTFTQAPGASTIDKKTSDMKSGLLSTVLSKSL